jgi:ferric-dicitrate binding protein FerR (iron transport regulator)
MAMYEHSSGTADTTVTVPSGRRVRRYSCLAGGSGGTITITPKGGSAQSVITVPANQPFGDDLATAANDLDYVELADGSTIAFAGMASWFVRYA